MIPKLADADLIFVSSNSLISRLIKWGSSTKSNKKAIVSHVAGVVYPSILNIAEANVSGIEITHLLDRYGKGKHKVAIYRAKNIPSDVKAAMAAEAVKRVGTRYGFASILQHLIDNKLFGGKIVARKLNIPDSQICSELWGSIFKQFGYDFNGNLSPDEMLDFCISNPEKYEEIRSLELLNGVGKE